MATEFCPECHQPISGVVEGVRLPSFKARLFRFVESHPGQSGRELASHFYDTPLRWPVHSIRCHIFQINELLMNTAVRIQGGGLAGYRVERGSSL